MRTNNDFTNQNIFNNNHMIKIRINDSYEVSLDINNAISKSDAIKNLIFLNQATNEINFEIPIKDIETYKFLDKYFQTGMPNHLFKKNQLDDLLNIGIAMQIPEFLQIYMAYNPYSNDLFNNFIEIFRYIDFSAEFVKYCVENYNELGEEKIIYACLKIGLDFSELLIFNLQNAQIKNEFIADLIANDSKFLHLLTYYDRSLFKVEDYNKISKSVSLKKDYNEIYNDFAMFSINYIKNKSLNRTKFTQTMKIEEEKIMKIKNLQKTQFEYLAKKLTEMKNKHKKRQWILCLITIVLFVLLAYFAKDHLPNVKIYDEKLAALFNLWRNSTEDREFRQNMKNYSKLIKGVRDINLKDEEGKTLVYNAYYQRNYKFVNILVENGADLNIPYKNESCCLQLAILRKDYHYIKYFIDHGANINNPPRIKELYERYISKTHMQPMLYYAIQSGDVKIVRDLINYGANINAYYISDDGHLKPISQFAVENGSDEIIDLFLNNRKLDLNLVEIENYESLLHVSCRYNKTKISIRLINMGCNVNAIQKHSKQTPLTITYFNQNIEVFEHLLKNGANTEILYNSKTLLHRTVEEEKYEFAKMLLKYHANVNSIDANRETPLHIASKLKNTSFLILLINKGADVNAIANYGVTPFLVASNNSIEACAILLDRGANINDKDDYGQTAFYNCMIHNYFKFGITLIERGIKVSHSFFVNTKLPPDFKIDSEYAKNLRRRGFVINEAYIAE
ncbi:hypothetical protein TVAG_019460 [Trichomonas vaginalis G3]|uniref:Uncharacterized protein n=1 Tax=Trichomonas vaginalis (strain ATCC PRA-98 / G3) TaxID=412133 RepID=A2DX19_TRIV3|nr:spectrin binding [Trichomonas vaginalis G3]EAY15046.1 hypothetical protein TVAG_019460 [Trichomonas vaginalis G3]KAI5549587.1 spectrin binding [Trichomonas vaginalis G3]|eukprot:XP_001327269.1 hypothetical protein [Trichomonas vaginalis G3]